MRPTTARSRISPPPCCLDRLLRPFLAWGPCASHQTACARGPCAIDEWGSWCIRRRRKASYEVLGSARGKEGRATTKLNLARRSRIARGMMVRWRVRVRRWLGRAAHRSAHFGWLKAKQTESAIELWIKRFDLPSAYQSIGCGRRRVVLFLIWVGAFRSVWTANASRPAANQHNTASNFLFAFIHYNTPRPRSFDLLARQQCLSLDPWIDPSKPYLRPLQLPVARPPRRRPVPVPPLIAPASSRSPGAPRPTPVVS